MNMWVAVNATNDVGITAATTSTIPTGRRVRIWLTLRISVHWGPSLTSTNGTRRVSSADGGSVQGRGALSQAGGAPPRRGVAQRPPAAAIAPHQLKPPGEAGVGEARRYGR